MNLSIKSLFVCLAVAAFAGCASSKKVEPTEKKEAPTAAATPAPQKAEPMKEEAPKKELKAKTAKKTEPNMAASAPTGAGLSCSSGSDTRTLEAKTTDTGGCELHYTKMGNSSIVATQISGSEKCNEVQAKIKSNLEGAGFQCAN